MNAPFLDLQKQITLGVLRVATKRFKTIHLLVTFTPMFNSSFEIETEYKIINMSNEREKKNTNFYWPSIKGDWKIFRNNSHFGNTAQKLEWCEETHFAWNIPSSINDCALYNYGFRTCLDSLEISSIESVEIIRTLKSSEDNSNKMEVESSKNWFSNSNSYLELMKTAAGISNETLADAYIKSRILKWSRSSIESKFNIPINILTQ